MSPLPSLSSQTLSCLPLSFSWENGCWHLCSFHVFHNKSKNSSFIRHLSYNYATSLQEMSQRQITKYKVVKFISLKKGCATQLFKKVFFSFQDKFRSALSYQSYYNGTGTATNNICFLNLSLKLHRDIYSIQGPLDHSSFLLILQWMIFGGLYHLIIIKGHSFHFKLRPSVCFGEELHTHFIYRTSEGKGYVNENF